MLVLPFATDGVPPRSIAILGNAAGTTARAYGHYFPATRVIIYLMKKDESKYVAAHAKESLNFQITMFIVYFVLAISIIGIFLIWIFVIIAFIFVIIATIKASENKLYKYPVNFRIIK